MKKIVLSVVMSLLAASVYAEPAPATVPQPRAATKPVTDAERASAEAQHQLDRLDTDKDGKISKAEALAPVEAAFKKADANGDGAITKAELEAAVTKAIGERNKLMADQQARIQAILKDAAKNAAKTGDSPAKP